MESFEYGRDITKEVKHVKHLFLTNVT